MLVNTLVKVKPALFTPESHRPGLVVEWLLLSHVHFTESFTLIVTLDGSNEGMLVILTLV